MVDTYAPQISVVMSVRNDERYLRASVESILNQTYTDFEFIIFDDCSTDRSLEILRAYTDPRLRIIANDRNLGLTRNLNKGLVLSRGKYIARQDSDDVSLPSRFQEQIARLEADRDLAVIGAWVTFIDGQGNALLTYETPTGPTRIYRDLEIKNCVVHPSVMFRREAVLSLGGYDESFVYAQDYELWLRVSELFGIDNLPRVLLNYRVHEGQITSRKLGKQWVFSHRARQSALRRRGISERAAWLKRLFGCPGSLGYDFCNWAGICTRIGNVSEARRLKIFSILYSPLSAEAWDTIVPRAVTRRLAWYRKRVTGC